MVTIRSLLAAVSLTFASITSWAFPIASVGTEGLFVLATGGDVVATFQGHSAGYTNYLYLTNTNTFIFNNQATSVGTSVNLGSFSAGTELKFRLYINNTGEDFFTGPSSRNPDGLAHARVQSNWNSGLTLVSFEDLNGAPEGVYGYNDTSFSLTNAVGAASLPAIPEPSTYALMAFGLGFVGFLSRRRAKRS